MVLARANHPIEQLTFPRIVQFRTVPSYCSSPDRAPMTRLQPGGRERCGRLRVAADTLALARAMKNDLVRNRFKNDALLC
jgi:hypothetical protein